MAYLNEDGLARYDGLIKNWVTLKSGTVDGVDLLLNWQKTETAGAVTFSPLPTAPIDPVINFLFTETDPASGTKSPDNPSTITGVTQAKVTRCGKNLINFPYSESTSFTRAGITYTTATDGSITANGTATDRSVFYILGSSRRKRYYAGETITVSGIPQDAPENCRLLFERNRLDGSYIGNYGITSNNPSYTFVAQDDGFFGLSIVINSGVTVSNVVFNPQIELGSTATSFEPYSGTDYTIQLGNTYYGGEIDLATGLMTVTSVLETITPSRPFLPTSLVERNNSYLLAYFPSVARQKQSLTSNVDIVCNSMPCIYGTIQDERCVQFNGGGAGIGLNLLKIDLGLGSGETADVVKDAFISWLEGKNIEVVYPVLTPLTVQITPTQIYSLSQPDHYTPRINTVYSDQVSVQVGYPKSPIATASELTNAIVSLGSNL